MCCRASSESAPGCSAVSNLMDECELKAHVDSDREMQRLASLLAENMPKLEKKLSE